MNRRSFFNSLSAAVAGCYLAAHVRLADVVQKASIPVRKMAMVNPAWINAHYERGFIFLTPGFLPEPWPMRLADDMKTVIPPFIEVEVGA